MATESLVAIGILTLLLLGVSIYANKHRDEHKKDHHKNEHAA